MEIHFKTEMEINQQQINLPSSSSHSAADDVSTGFNRLKPEGSDNQSEDDDDVSFRDYNSQHLKPEDAVNQSAEDDVSTGFNSLKPEYFVDQSADDDVITGFTVLKPDGSVNQSADDDVSTGFSHPHIDDANDDQHPKPEGSVNLLADDDLSTGLNRLKPEASVDQSADDDDVSSGGDNNQHMIPHDSGDQSAADDVSFVDDSVNQSAADDDVSFHNGSSVDQSANDDDVSSGDDSNNQKHDDVSFSHDSVAQSADGDVSFGLNHLQIDSKDEEEDDDDDVDSDFTFACVGDNDSFNGYETGDIRTVFPLFDQSLLLGDDYNDGKLKLPVNVPVNKIYIESPSNNGTVQALSDETGSMKMKSNSTGFSKLWRFRKEMNRSNSDSRDAFVFFEKSTEKVNVTGRSSEKVNVTGGKGKAVRKDLNSKKVASSAHEVYLKQKGGQSEEERRRSYLPYRPGLMGFFTNVNGGLSKNVHPF